MRISPLTAEEAQHLADYTLERLAAGLADNQGETGTQLNASRYHDVAIALQRLIGALAGDAAELRLLAMLDAPNDYLFGPSARAIAEARACAADDAAAQQALRAIHEAQPSAVPA